MNKPTLVITLSAALLGLGSWMVGSSRAAALDQPAGSYSAAALYNAGNAYARTGKPALAVLDYERARLLAPMDPDLRENLHHVRESAGLPARGGSWLSEHDRLTDPNTMYWLGLFGLTLAGAGFLARRVSSKHRVALAGAAIAGLVLSAVSVCDALATASILNEAVVMQTSPADAAPISCGEPLFAVPQADIVHVRDEHQGFVLIRDSEGREGWVARTDLTSIIPDHAIS
jgi:hypothetical protein